MVSETLTRPNLQKILSSLSKTDIVWAMKFLTDILAEEQPKISEKNDEEYVPNPKPVWWDLPISPEVLAMQPSKRFPISDNYKEELYKALEEKYK